MQTVGAAPWLRGLGVGNMGYRIKSPGALGEKGMRI